MERWHVLQRREFLSWPVLLKIVDVFFQAERANVKKAANSIFKIVK